ncbi:MAG: glycosyltransferase [Candidatus Aegiribacteria sp.]|nr:glycosyltransferase [Candidatus Aegiribacteria sp.]MBD3294468.1 glycosyltransferase [Candidatus Fermentibacteria bacterium]
MRVLEVYKDVYPFVQGGIERYMHDLSGYLADQGHDVSVLVASDRCSSKGISGFGIERYRCLGRLLSNPVSIGLAGMLRKYRGDLVHFHVPLPSAVLAWLRSGRRIGYMVTYHSDIVRQKMFMPFYGPFLRRFLKGAELVLATSPVYAETSRYLSDLDNVDVVPIGTDLRFFTPSSENSHRAYVLFVGRFRSYKGIEVLMETWRQFPRKKLIMVGGGPMEVYVREHTHRYGLDIEILNDPEDEELRELYRNAQCLVLPSTMRSEAFGMVQVEAMACGLPVVSTNLPTGVPWVNRNGVTGLVVPPEDPEALADAIRKMEDEGLRNRLSRSALSRARSEFDARELFRRTEELMLKAVRGGKE